MPDFLPPGPPAVQGLAYFRQMRSNPLKLFSDLQASYGDLACMQVGPQKICLVQEPALVHRILTRDSGKFKKGRFLELAKDLLGEGLLTSEGELHKTQRLLIQPLFHKQMIRSYAAIMVKWGERFAQRWQAGQTLDLAQEMMKLTLAIVGEALFSADVEAESAHIGEAMETVLDISIMGRPLQMLTRKWPTPTRQRFLHAKSLLDTTIHQVMAQHRQQPSGLSTGATAKNLVSILLDAQDEHGQGMSDQQVRDEALTLFLAGHETTANALAWSWYLLSQSPRVQQRFQTELQAVLGGRTPTVDDLNQLSYTRQILTEAMRLYPPAWILGRRVLEDYPLGPYWIPAGTVVIISPYLQHRSGRFFDEPLSFRPERWTPEFKQALPKCVYFPFSTGPRNCIGEAFAWMEGVLLLATLGQHWRFVLEPGHPVEPQPLVTLRPRYGLKMHLQAL